MESWQDILILSPTANFFSSELYWPLQCSCCAYIVVVMKSTEVVWKRIWMKGVWMYFVQCTRISLVNNHPGGKPFCRVLSFIGIDGALPILLAYPWKSKLCVKLLFCHHPIFNTRSLCFPLLFIFPQGWCSDEGAGRSAESQERKCRWRGGSHGWGWGKTECRFQWPGCDCLCCCWWHQWWNFMSQCWANGIVWLVSCQCTCRGMMCFQPCCVSATAVICSDKMTKMRHTLWRFPFYQESKCLSSGWVHILLTKVYSSPWCYFSPPEQLLFIF